MSRGSTADIDPHAWEIVDDKLYLNFNASIQRKWQEDKHTNIIKADKNWPSILQRLLQK